MLQTSPQSFSISLNLPWIGWVSGWGLLSVYLLWKVWMNLLADILRMQLQIQIMVHLLFATKFCNDVLNRVLSLRLFLVLLVLLIITWITTVGKCSFFKIAPAAAQKDCYVFDASDFSNAAFLYRLCNFVTQPSYWYNVPSTKVCSNSFSFFFVDLWTYILDV